MSDTEISLHSTNPSAKASFPSVVSPPALFFPSSYFFLFLSLLLLRLSSMLFFFLIVEDNVILLMHPNTVNKVNLASLEPKKGE